MCLNATLSRCAVLLSGRPLQRYDVSLHCPLQHGAIPHPPLRWQKDRAITSLGRESASSGGQKGSWVTGRPDPLSHERGICLPSLALLIKLTLRYHSEAWTSLIVLGLAWGHEKNTDTGKHTHITSTAPSSQINPYTSYTRENNIFQLHTNICINEWVSCKHVQVTFHPKNSILTYQYWNVIIIIIITLNNNCNIINIKASTTVYLGMYINIIIIIWHGKVRLSKGLNLR